MSKTYTKEELELIRQMRKQQQSWETIGLKLNRDPKNLRIKAEKASIDTKPLLSRKPKERIEITEQIKKTIIEGLADDLTWQQIAYKLNWTKSRTIEMGRKIFARKLSLELKQERINKMQEQNQEATESSDFLFSSDKRKDALPPGHPITWSIIAPNQPNPFDLFSEKEKQNNFSHSNKEGL